MTALANDRSRSAATWKHRSFTLASGSKAYKGGRAALNSTGKVVPASTSPSLLAIGLFDETVDATSAAKPVSVDLEREIVIEWFDNAAGGDAVLATDVGALCYMYDDQTVTITSTGRSLAGRVWAVDSIKGVAVECQHKGIENDPDRLLLDSSGLFTSNAWAPVSVVHDTAYAVPATGAASTITLPTAAADGTRVYFHADGTANGHTVQYKDEAGTTNITTALTASKRHLVECVKSGGKWNAIAYVSP